MANYADSVLLNARIMLNDPSQKQFTQRPPISNISKAFDAGQAYIRGRNGESIDQLKKATTQATEILYQKKQTFTSTTSKTCTPSGDFGDSGKVTLTWAQLVRTIKVPEKVFFGNQYTRDMYIANMIWQMERDIFLGANGMEALFLAYLEAQRTHVNAISAGGSQNTWVGTPTFSTQVANADVNRFYNYALADMNLNGYTGPFFDVHDIGWNAEVAYYAQQGTANSVNTAFQFDGFNRLATNKIVPTGYDKSVHYILQEGGVAWLTWNDQLNVNRKQALSGGEWTTMESMMMPGVTYDVFAKDACADTTSTGGATQDYVNNLEFTINYALVKQPIDVSNETPIFKYNVLA